MYYQNYKNRPAGQGGYFPKKPVKSFQDLEVYQITAGLAAVIVKRIGAEHPAADIGRPSGRRSLSRSKAISGAEPALNATAISAAERITEKLFEYVLDIPIQLTVAHSRRFGHGRVCLDHLEKAMLECNLAAAYLEQYRDIVNAAIEADFFEDCIKKYLAVRGKILRLSRSWQKFIELNREENK